MPNYVDNRVVISVPSDRADDLVAALEGPAQWPVPDGLLPSFGRATDLSQHARIQAAAKIADGSALREIDGMRDTLGWPSWMKPTLAEIEKVAAGTKIEPVDTVPLSFPRLAPWTGPEEYARYFPDATPDDPLHAPTENPRGFNLRDFQKARMGTSRTPGDFSTEITDEDGRKTVVIRFTTAWSGVGKIAQLLDDVLRAHGAKMLYTWVEEQGYCGYTYSNPADDLLEEDEFDAENNWQVAQEDEDYPDETFYSFDREAFEAEVADIVADAHL